MHTHEFSKKKLILPIAFFVASCFNLANAQTTDSSNQPQHKVTNVTKLKEPAPNMDLACAGYIEYKPSTNRIEIIGGQQEQEQSIFSERNMVFINAGAQQGVRVGQEFLVVRPRGKFKSSFSKKRGQLGVYTQEVGRIRVKDVKARVSVAEVLESCDMILFGDLLKPWQERTAPQTRSFRKLDHFSDPNGKQTGRIVLSRNGREMVSRSDIVFVDLGKQDGVKKGDYLTIYRPGGTGNITEFKDDNVGTAASGGFESDEFKGGKFSNHAPRTKKAEGSAHGATTSIPDVKSRRPSIPRKVVGEMVILDVQERTASAIITQVEQEIHTGDYVELQ